MKNMNKILAYLRLIRVPNGFTAIADSWAGYIICAGMSGISFFTLFCHALASFCLYSAGIVLNDLHDQAVDSHCNPHRPLPSGMIRRRDATVLLVCLLLMAFIACLLLGWMPVAIAGAVCVSIVMYDIVFKKTPFAPIWMGACRMFNMILGMSAASARFYESLYILIPVFMCIYVMLLTVASKYEKNMPKGRLLCIALVVWVLLTYGASDFLNIATHNTGIFYLAIWALIGGIFYIYCRREDSVRSYRMFIVFFILSIPAVDSIFIAGIRGGHAGLFILACLIPTILFSFCVSAH